MKLWRPLRTIWIEWDGTSAQARRRRFWIGPVREFDSDPDFATLFNRVVGKTNRAEIRGSGVIPVSHTLRLHRWLQIRGKS